jgi:hypothetical protein
MGTLTGRKKSGQAWFWHTEHDTLDKVDLDVLELDTKIYLLTILRLTNSPILPFDYAATVDELLGALKRYQALLGTAVDLEPVVARARQLRESLEQLSQRTNAQRLDAAARADVNEALTELGRVLVPLNYTEKGQFDHDWALHAPALPLLRLAEQLERLQPTSDEYRYLTTQLLSRRNQVSFAFRQAQRLVDEALATVERTNGGQS